MGDFMNRGKNLGTGFKNRGPVIEGGSFTNRGAEDQPGREFKNRGQAWFGGPFKNRGQTALESWSPAALFAASEVGAWYDPSDLSTMWTDDGTTQAGVGDLIYRIDDKSGNGFHAKQTAEASRPILRQSGGKYYLEFDGTDDFFVTAAIDFTGTDEMDVFAGVYRANDSTCLLVELSADVNANAGTFTHLLGVDVRDYYALARGSAAAAAGQSSTITQAGPDLAVTSGLHDISADSSVCRRNGISAAAGTADKGTGNFGNYALYIGRRGGASLPLNGSIYGLIVRGKTSDATEIANVESYLNGKTGAY